MLHVQQELRRAVRVGGDDHLLGGVGVMVRDARLAAPSRDGACAPRTRLPRGGRGRTPRGARGPRRRASRPGRGSSSSACSSRCGRSRCCTCRTRCSRCAAGRRRRSTDRRPRRPGSPKYTPTGAWLNVSPRPISIATLLHDPIDVGRHVRVADDAEHPRRLVDVRRQLVGPVGDARPLRRVEELLRRHVQACWRRRAIRRRRRRRRGRARRRGTRPAGSRRARRRGTTGTRADATGSSGGPRRSSAGRTPSRRPGSPSRRRGARRRFRRTPSR